MATSGNRSVRHLWLLRHGKAASDAPWGGSDKERPLTARGRRDAVALGARLAGEQPVLGLEAVPPPDLAICSAAIRTRQTADLVAEAMGGRLPVDAYQALYGGDPDLLLQYVREIDEGVRSALFVGHNPTVFEVAWLLLQVPADGDDPTTDRAVLEAFGFPTCALAVLTLGVGAWEDVVHGCADLAGVFKPPY
jgi:phosphohistidine phosphatase